MFHRTKNNAVTIAAMALMGFTLIPADETTGPEKLRSNLKGEWRYLYSNIDGQKKRLETDKHCPVYKMVFSECDDAKDMKISHPVVISTRKTNALKNLKSVTYSDSIHPIDTYFPVAMFLANDSATITHILEYGHKFKSDYFIDKLEGDTLVLHDGSVHTVDSKTYNYVRHTYCRKKK